MHHSELRTKYGSPLVVMNLIKRVERKPHEAILHERFLQSVRYLNQFVEPADRIAYAAFDVSRCNKQVGLKGRER